MTVEEAIKIFNDWDGYFVGHGSDDVTEALTMAINALQAEQNAYKEGYDACKRIMAREKQFNSYCPRCMGKLETCEDCVSRQEVNDLVDELARAISDERCNVLRKRSPAIIMHAILKLPSVQPEPFINKPCVSEQACHEDKMQVLEKIKAEIEAKCCITVGREYDGVITLHDIFEIIDKYKAESEDKECESNI